MIEVEGVKRDPQIKQIPSDLVRTRQPLVMNPRTGLDLEPELLTTGVEF